MRARLRASTAFRFAFFFSLAFTLVTLALGAAIYFAIRGELRYDLRQRIETERTAVLREADASGIAAVIADRAAHEHGDMRYALVGADGRLLAGEPFLRAPRLGWSTMKFREPDGSGDPTRVFASTTPDGATLIVGADPEALEELDHRLIPLFIVSFGLIAAIGVAGAFLLGRALRRRLEAIDRTANAIIAGDLGRRVPLSGTGDEFDTLASTLNQMLERIADLLDNLRQVSGDIAHDLRTPLTRLRQKLELAAAGDGEAPALREAMLDAIEQTDDMLSLFAAILGISEVEAGTARRAEVDLSALIADLADSYAPSVEDGGRQLVRAIAPGVKVEGSRELLAQLGVNLLDNALNHTPAGTTIGIALEPGDGAARLTVWDEGAGIPADERSHVFKRFTRLEASRSTPGHGLGLSLVAAIAKAHGGTVAVEDNQPGARFMVTLPRTKR
jgi:signal transduction histidine kinase